MDDDYWSSLVGYSKKVLHIDTPTTGKESPVALPKALEDAEMGT